ncbi:hypothetical protein D3C72_593440 [compost metagenome]
MRRDQLDERLAHQAGLARTGHTGHRREDPQREGHVEVVQIVARDTFERQPAFRRAGRAPGPLRAVAEEVLARVGLLDVSQPLERAAVEHAAALLAGVGADVHDPVRVTNQVQLVLDDEERVAGPLELIERAQQRLGVGRVQPGGGLVEHVDHPEEVRVNLGGEAHALKLARRERGRAALERQVPQPQLDERRDALKHLLGDAARDDDLLRRVGVRGRLAAGGGRQDLGQTGRRQSRDLSDVEAREGHRERLAAQALALAQRALGVHHVARDALFHHLGLGRRERVEHVAPRAHEGAHVVGRLFALEGALGLRQVVARVDRHHGLLLGEEDPVADRLGQGAPRHVHVVAERGEDVAQVLAAPGGGPGGDRPLANGQIRVRHHRSLGDLVEPPQPVALRAGAGRGVGRKRVRVEPAEPRGVGAGARVEHAQRVRERGHAAHRRSRGGAAAVLLERHGRRQALDAVHLGHPGLIDQPPGIWRHRLEVAPLRLGVERAEGQRALAGARDAGEDHQRVARHGQIHVLEVVLARAAHAHEALLGLGRGRRGWGAVGAAHGGYPSWSPRHDARGRARPKQPCGDPCYRTARRPAPPIRAAMPEAPAGP